MPDNPPAPPGPATRPGRTPGGPDNRQVILDAARGLFAQKGFAGTTIRQVALGAAVDPSLVMHFFGSKRGLFQAVVDLPVSGDLLLTLLGLPAADRPAALTEFLLTVLHDEDQLRRLTSLLRTAATEPAVAEMLRDLLAHAYEPLVAEYGQQGRVTANLLGTLAVGLVMARTVVGIQPLADLPREELSVLLQPIVATILQQLPEPLRPPQGLGT